MRGYLAGQGDKASDHGLWVWDVFDSGRAPRALRISGEETAKVRHRDAWAAADDAMLQRASPAAGMDQLAAFLTSPDVAPVPRRRRRRPQVARRSQRVIARAAGHLRVFQSRRPIRYTPGRRAADDADHVRLPCRCRRRRPAALRHRSSETLTFAASEPLTAIHPFVESRDNDFQPYCRALSALL